MPELPPWSKIDASTLGITSSPQPEQLPAPAVNTPSCPVPSDDGLDDLFTPSSAESASPAYADPAVPADDGLDDLFADPPVTPIAPPTFLAPPPATTSEPASSAAPADQIAPPTLLAPPPATTSEPASSAAPADQIAPPIFGQSHDAAPSSNRGLSMTGATAKAMPNVTSRSIATLGPDQLASLEAQRAMFDAQLRAREHLYSVMDSMLSFIAQDPDLQLMVNEFTLTRDKELDARQRSELQERVTPRLLDARINIPNPRDIETVFDLAYDELIGISVVGDLWRDDDVDEILIDAWDRICVERFGRIEETGRRFRSPDHAMAVSRHLSQMISDRAVSRTNALVTAQLPRARVQFIWGNIAASGLAISIRKFNDLMGMESLLAGASLSEEMRDFLIDAVAARATILVSGGTGTGKTTMINALSEFIPDDERVITIEDAFELRLSNRHVVAMQAKTRTSADDTVTYTQEDLMVASLRMRPDRIIVGEIREPSAAAVMLQAANTGHDGTMTTLHATSASVALNNRMVVLLMRSGTGFSEDTARLEVASAFNLVIQITRSQRTGHRYVSEIALVDTSLLDSSSVRALSLFSGELMVAPDPDDPGTDKTTAYFRQVGRIPRTSALGMKMLDTGNDTSRWLA